MGGGKAPPEGSPPPSAGGDPKVSAFSDRVNEAISNVLPSNDPFDQATFDPIAYLNTTFPDSESLDKLDEFYAMVQAKISSVNVELLGHVREQSLTKGEGGGTDFSSAAESITNLFSKVEEIKTKAEQSESIVHNISKDIKSLDNAKHNLSSGITTLERPQMLEQSVASLESLAAEDEFEEASRLLGASAILVDYFKEQAEMGEIRTLVKSIRSLQGMFRKRVLHTYGSQGIKETPDPQFKYACRVMTALGEDACQALAKGIIDKEMETYKNMFPDDDPTAQVSGIDKRFSYFRKVIQAYDENMKGCVPSEWCVLQELLVEFCLITNAAMQQQLTRLGNLDQTAIQAISKSVMKTVDFEKEMTRRFELYANAKDAPPKAIKYTNFSGFIKTAFDPHMGEIVAAERAGLWAAIDDFIRDDQAQKETEAGEEDGEAEADELEEEGAVLPSATLLFSKLRDSLRRMVSISKGQYLLEVSNIWCQGIVYYASELTKSLQSAKGDTFIRQVCLAINTAEYWSAQSVSLCDNIQDQIEELFRAEVSMDDGESACLSTVQEGVRALIREIYGRLEEHLNALEQIPWANVEEVSDTSAYVTAIMGVVGERFREVVKHLNPVYLRLFMDRFTLAFSKQLIGRIMRVKRISINGGQLLQLDVHTLRGFLQDLPTTLEGGGSSILGKNYVKVVQREMKKAENIAKLMVAPLTPSITEQYVDMMGKTGSISDFTKIMEIKGVPKAEMKGLVEALARKGVSAKEPESKDDGLYATEEGGRSFAALRQKFRGLGGGRRGE